MAQDIQSILQQLDAGYNPQRQAINDQIAQLQPQADQQIQGLKQQQTNAFGDITNAARDRGMGFSGIPIDEQAKYTGGTFLPAVAGVQKSVQDSKNSLLSSLNNLGLDQYKTAYSVQQNQQDMEEKQREFDQQLAAQKDAAAKAAAAQNASMASLLGGGGFSGGGTTAAPVASDPYARVDKNGANASVKSMLASGDVNRIARELNAISSSASYGNMMDKYKLDLLNSLRTNSQYGQILSKVANKNSSKVIGASY